MAVSVIGVVLCRLAAVLLFVQALENLGLWFPAAAGSPVDDAGMAVIVVLVILAPAIAGTVIWVFAERIVRLRQNAVPVEAGAMSAGAAELIAAGTLLIGVYAATFGLVDAVRIEVGIWAQTAVGGGPFGSSREDWIHRLQPRAGYAAQIALGSALILGSERLAGLLRKLRYAGRDTD